MSFQRSLRVEALKTSANVVSDSKVGIKMIFERGIGHRKRMQQRCLLLTLQVFFPSECATTVLDVAFISGFDLASRMAGGSDTQAGDLLFH